MRTIRIMFLIFVSLNANAQSLLKPGDNSIHYCPIKIGFKIRVIFCRQRLQVKNLLFQYGGVVPPFFML